MPDTLNWKDLLKSNSLFRELEGQDLERLLRHSNERIYEAKDHILEKGDFGETLFVLGKGTASVILTQQDNTKLTISTLKKDDLFGEMAFLEQKPRSATVIANEQCIVREFDAQNFKDVLVSYPYLEFQVMTLLSQRLRRLTEETLQIQIHELNKKIELIDSKIESDHKIFDNAIKTTRSHFEATNASVNRLTEQTASVIEKEKSYLTAIKWVSGIVSGIFIILAPFGIYNANDLYQGIVKKSDELEGNLSKLEKLTAQTNSVFAKLEFQEKFVEPKFWKHIGTEDIFSQELQNLDSADAKETFFTILNLRDPDITKDLLSHIMRDMIDDLGERTKYRNHLITVLDDNLQRHTDQERLIIYYFLLAAHQLNGNHAAFTNLRKDLEAYLEKYLGNGLPKKDLYNDFNPGEFQSLIKAEIVTAKRNRLIRTMDTSNAKKTVTTLSDSASIAADPEYSRKLSDKEIFGILVEADEDARKMVKPIEEVWDLLPDYREPG